MIRVCLFLLLVLNSSFALDINCQSSILFDSFVGDVYELPYSAKNLPKGFEGFDDDFEKIGRVNWESIDFQDDYYDNLMPGVIRKDRFAVILESTMQVEHPGCYELSLNSDDGSILWINDIEIINNDGSHKMTLIKDTVELEIGVYPIKLWYYNAYPDRRGFEFGTKILSRTCPDGLISKQELLQSKEVSISLLNEVLFDQGSAMLKHHAHSILEKIIVQIQDSKATRIEIIGHTDSVGLELFNMNLSEKRAQAVMNYLLSNMQKPDLIFVAIAKGENEPIGDNDTEEGRQKNRRVELKLKQ